MLRPFCVLVCVAFTAALHAQSGSVSLEGRHASAHAVKDLSPSSFLRVNASLSSLAKARAVADPQKVAKSRTTWYFIGIVAALVAFGGVIVGLVLWFIARSIGKLIEVSIEELAPEIIGVNVNLDYLQVYMFTGAIYAYNIVVDNPPGWEGKKYLLKADAIKVDINMLGVILRRKELQVQELTFKNVDVNYEKGLMSSNMGDLLAMVQGDKPKPEPKAKPAPAELKDPPEPPAEYILKKVQLVDVGATLPFVGRVSIPDIIHEDFDKDPGGRTISAIVLGIVKSLATGVFSAK